MIYVDICWNVLIFDELCWYLLILVVFVDLCWYLLIFDNICWYLTYLLIFVDGLFCFHKYHLSMSCLLCLEGASLRIDYRSFAHRVYDKLGLRRVSGAISAQKCVDICWYLFILDDICWYLMIFDDICCYFAHRLSFICASHMW